MTLPMSESTFRPKYAWWCGGFRYLQGHWMIREAHPGHSYMFQLENDTNPHEW